MSDLTWERADLERKCIKAFGIAQMDSRRISTLIWEHQEFEDEIDILRAQGFTDPKRQVEEAILILRMFANPNNYGPENYIKNIAAKKLLAELDAEKDR